MLWAVNRLGANRIKNSYAYKDLMNQNGMIALGTDFPIENINPIETFYAAVVRKNKNNEPINGFQKENALSRIDALKGMTIWAAMANFEENDKGTLEVGKYADFIILSQDLLTVPEENILNTFVTHTFVNGEKVFGK
jgi:predicted amidohydrolase YtcJ